MYAHAGAGDRADARAQDLLGPVTAPADEVAEQVAAERTDTRAPTRAGNATLAGFGIGHARAGQRQRGQGRNRQQFRSDHVSPFARHQEYRVLVATPPDGE